MIRLSPSDAPSFARKATRPEIPRCGCTSDPFALHLEFRAPDRTLTDEEVAGQREAIIEALGQELGGRIRGA